jgi:eukaryotic-like serine/threonine-protein kinase
MLGNHLHSRYSIVKFLGVGRSGQTYLAEDRDLPGNPPCIVKRIQYPGDDSFIQPLAARMFEVQTEILHRLGTHPQIPSLIAKFEEQGEMYLVREYIDGEFLSEEFSYGNKWSQTQVFDFLSDMMSILSFIHSFKYIHQDINPNNLIRRKSDGRFAIIGFGAIKDSTNVWQNLPQRAQERINSVAVGTPGYIPYEQEQNSPKFNSDLYAVGTIAIQALTGEFPVPKDPITYELDWKDRVNINLRLVDIINKLVRPDYRNRYQSADEVIKDLHAFALTQIPRSKFDRIKPHLIFSGAATALLLGFLTVKSTIDRSPQPSLIAVTNPDRIVDANRATWQTYRDSQAKLKIKYYPTWSIDSINNLITGETVSFVSPNQSPSDRYRERVSVRTENLSDAKMTLADYTKSAIAEINRFYRNAKIIESTPSTLAKNPANIVVYTGTNEQGIAIKNLETWTVKNGKVYIITYQADPAQYYAFLQTVMTMINSVELN